VISNIPDGPHIQEFFTNDDIYITLTLSTQMKLEFWIGIKFTDILSQKIIMVSDTAMQKLQLTSNGPEFKITLFLPHIKFIDSEYSISLAVLKKNTTQYYDQIENASGFKVLPTDIYGSERLVTSYQGIVHLDNMWLDSDFQLIQAK
jgi:hypothetical protein